MNISYLVDFSFSVISGKPLPLIQKRKDTFNILLGNRDEYRVPQVAQQQINRRHLVVTVAI